MINEFKKNLKDIFFLIMLPIVMIIYYIKYHQMQHLLLGSAVTLLLGAIICGAYAKTKKMKSYSILFAGLFCVLASILFSYLTWTSQNQKGL